MGEDGFMMNEVKMARPPRIEKTVFKPVLAIRPTTLQNSRVINK